MLSSARCNACLKDKHLRDHPADASPEAVAEYRRRVIEIVDGRPELSSPEKDCEINLAYAAIFGASQDFGPVKRHFNQMLMSMEPAMLRDARAAEDPLKRAVQYAMTGNFIDFAAMERVDEARLRALIAESGDIPIDRDALERLRDAVSSARRLTYIVDNCGEIVMDRVLMQTIRDIHPSIEITAVVKGAPIVNDATREDAEQVRLSEVARHIVDTGCGIAGCPEGRLSEACLDALNGADVLISKGQANYETLCGCGRNLYYIFMCKCQLFMERFGVEQFSGLLTRELP